jgi:hypothetical protein
VLVLSVMIFLKSWLQEPEMKHDGMVTATAWAVLSVGAEKLETT